jgi:hypothetical protein
MTNLYYSSDCADALQVCGEASSPVANNGDNAWNVNFNNGNVNNDNKNNSFFVRLVRASECFKVAKPRFVLHKLHILSLSLGNRSMRCSHSCILAVVSQRRGQNANDCNIIKINDVFSPSPRGRGLGERV